MANTTGEKELKTKWPHESGIELADKHDGRTQNLVAQEGSKVNRRESCGLNGR